MVRIEGKGIGIGILRPTPGLGTWINRFSYVLVTAGEEYDRTSRGKEHGLYLKACIGLSEHLKKKAIKWSGMRKWKETN